MIFTIPNSGGYPDLDEANVSSTHAPLMDPARMRLKKRRARRVREFNGCHEPSSGRFCGGGKRSWTLQRMKDAGRSRRANSLMARLEQQMMRVQGNVQRAVTLRKRMDVTGPMAYRHRQNTFLGTLRRGR